MLLSSVKFIKVSNCTITVKVACTAVPIYIGSTISISFVAISYEFIFSYLCHLRQSSSSCKRTISIFCPIHNNCKNNAHGNPKIFYILDNIS